MRILKQGWTFHKTLSTTRTISEELTNFGETLTGTLFQDIKLTSYIFFILVDRAEVHPSRTPFCKNNSGESCF